MQSRRPTPAGPRRGWGPRAFFLAWVALAGITAGAARADFQRVLLDGQFDDWDDYDPIWIDPLGDGGSSGIDIGAIWAAEDEDFLYLSIEVGGDLILQDYNQLTLYLDTDNNTATGFFLGAVGAELVWEFGAREGLFFHGSGSVIVAWADVHLITMPSHSGPRFELCLARDALPDGSHALFTDPSFHFLLRDWEGAGDWAPDIGQAIEYVFELGTPPPPLETIELERTPGPMRLLTYNVLQDQLFESGHQQAFRRILQALEPDVIAFQEIYNHTAAQTRTLIESWLGGSWDAQQISDKVTLTRSTILGTWSIAGGRAAACLITPPAALPGNLLVINAHLSCCDNDEARQEQVDAIMAFVRDAKTPGGLLDLTPENPIVITGDMNFVGRVRQLQTLLTGDIEDEGTYGPDFAPDWDDSDLCDRFSRQPLNGMGYTWFKPWSDYWPSRLDYVIFTDSNLSAPVSGILQTDLLPGSYLLEYGLEPDDTADASDHLPHFVDLEWGTQAAVDLPLPDGDRVRLRLAGPNPTRAGVELVLELPAALAAPADAAASVAVHDASGRRIRLIGHSDLHRRLQHLTWDGLDAAGRPVPQGTYWIRLHGPIAEGALRITVIR